MDQVFPAKKSRTIETRNEIMLSRNVCIHLNALIGFLVACYAYHVEYQLEQPGYEAACDLGTVFGIRMSCTKVFTSSYAHILSHWGLVESGHAMDLSLAESGMFLYFCYFVYPILTCIPMRKALFLAAAVAGGLFSCYLLYVLKFVLGDFCIVCTTFHCVNFGMLYLAVCEQRSKGNEATKEKPF
eukprot:g344.t1